MSRGISDQLSLPDWKLLRHQALVLPYQRVPEIRIAGFAFRFALAGLLPLPYMTRMDYFAVGIALLVFLALVGVFATFY